MKWFYSHLLGDWQTRSSAAMWRQESCDFPETHGKLFQSRAVFWQSSHRSVEHLRGFGQLGSAQFTLCLWTFSWAPWHHPASPSALGYTHWDFTHRGWNTWDALTRTERNQNAETRNSKMSNEWHQNLTEGKLTQRASRQMGTTEEDKRQQWRDDKTVARKKQCKNYLD